MPKISDLVGGSKAAKWNECATLLQVTTILRCSVAEVREKFAKFGTGMIYTRGLIASDTPKNREKLTEMYDEILVLFDDGTIFCRTKACKGQINRHRNRINRKRERDLSQRERDARAKERETERIFSAGLTKPCAKRQGRGNSHEDIGRYITPKKHWRRDNFTPRATDVFATIHIPGV